MEMKVAIEVGGLTVRAVRTGSQSSRIFATTIKTTKINNQIIKKQKKIISIANIIII